MSVAISNSQIFQHSCSMLTTPTHSPRPCSPMSRLTSVSHNPFKKTAVSVGEVHQQQQSSSSPSPSKLGFSKRKRPGRLDIPIAPPPLGLCQAEVGGAGVEGGGVVEESGGGDDDGVYGVCCKKGKRIHLEDRFSVDIVSTKQAIFGVFDGHGGSKAAEYAAEKLNKNILAEIKNKGDESDLKEAVKHGYLKTDSEFLKGELRGGSCCVTALITSGDLIVSNAGDCHAVMSRGGVAEALTTDHRPSRPDEKARIEAKGGYVDCYNGVWRIQGSLAVSRGIGDRQLKQWVISEPETRVVKIVVNDEFLILASDGLWDKVTNQEAVDIARPLCTGSNNPQPLAACKKLVDKAVARGSLDDVSVMIIPLERYVQ